MLRVATAKASARSLDTANFCRADATALPFAERSFAVIVAAGLFPNVNDHLRVLREMARVLRDDGRVLIVEFDRHGMNPATRWFVRMMIFGYRAISFVLRRYRFADSWNIRSSTIDPIALEVAAGTAGLPLASSEHLEGHLILELGKGTTP
jgi:ubiquinone/menaquinone biosynthesis C-methylase UbiE